jgi:AcrR family transcriptional regulator
MPHQSGKTDTITRMAKLRWGDDAPRDSTSAKERLVDAAARCFDRFGVLKTTIEDVAAEAKVSRATVYRYFADRDALILAVLVRETLKIGAVVDQAAVAHPDFSDAIVEAVLATIDAVRADHNLAMLMAPDAAA